MRITSCSYSSCFSCFVFSYPSCRCGPTAMAVLAFAGSAEESLAFTGSAEESLAFASSVGAMGLLACHRFPSGACWTGPMQPLTYHLVLSSLLLPNPSHHYHHHPHLSCRRLIDHRHRQSRRRSLKRFEVWQARPSFGERGVHLRFLPRFLRRQYPNHQDPQVPLHHHNQGRFHLHLNQKF